MTRSIFVFLAVFLITEAWASRRASGGAAQDQTRTTYDDVVAGMMCHQNTAQDLECNYRVGRSLHFGIAGVGVPDASVYFYSSSWEGDYFGVMGLGHGCVIVRTGKASVPSRVPDMAFVSPRDGKVYRTWQQCGIAK